MLLTDIALLRIADLAHALAMAIISIRIEWEGDALLITLRLE